MNYRTLIILPSLLLSFNVMAAPAITGQPVIVTPKNQLDWPSDFKQSSPYLTEPTSNRLNDIHGKLTGCDLVLSTAGNYHVPLRKMMAEFIPKNTFIKSYFYTTSPPISPEQIVSNQVQIGNVNFNCAPQVAVGPKKVMAKLIAANAVTGKPVKILKNQGNVILVKKGNPKNIKSVWDFNRPNVTLSTPNPDKEPGSFGNFTKTLYNIAKNDPNPPKNMTADKLFNTVFNSDQSNCLKSHKKCNWVAGKRIMHREQPWLINAGYADGGIIFYHTALFIVDMFPDKFEIVMLGGTLDQPLPLRGNKIGVLQAVRLKGPWNDKQKLATERLMAEFTSDSFTQILKNHGIHRP